jgi:hypothetical protein
MDAHAGAFNLAPMHAFLEEAELTICPEGVNHACSLGLRNRRAQGDPRLLQTFDGHGNFIQRKMLQRFRQVRFALE